MNLKENSIESYTLGPLDPLANAMQRIQELELELAKCKLEKCEAECLNDVSILIKALIITVENLI